jgi:hypothetical protein
MTKYISITSPDVEHDAANMITELILLNDSLDIPTNPWRLPKYRAFWGRTVSCIRKLMKDYELTPDQLAFYVKRCCPRKITSSEFAKAAVVARKLFRTEDLSDVVQIYKDRMSEYNMAKSIGEGLSKFKKQETKSLMQFLRELENATQKED